MAGNRWGVMSEQFFSIGYALSDTRSHPSSLLYFWHFFLSRTNQIRDPTFFTRASSSVPSTRVPVSTCPHHSVWRANDFLERREMLSGTVGPTGGFMFLRPCVSKVHHQTIFVILCGPSHSCGTHALFFSFFFFHL